jgi:hypothetical protein
MPDEYDPLITSEKRNIPQSERDKMPAAEFAGPHESFPIAKPEDIASAAHLIGKADDPEAVKARIIAIAKKHGWEKYLPAAWDAGEEGSEKPGAPDEAEKALFERVWDAIQTRLGRKESDAADDTTGFKVFEGADGKVHYLCIWGNNFKDRDGEIFTQDAIKAFVDRVDMGIVPKPELWVWHVPGTRLGQAEWVAQHGHFVLSYGTFDDTPDGRAGAAYYAKHADEKGISHGYQYAASGFDGKHYHAFNTFENSPLPLGAEANLYTSLEGVKALKMDEKKKQELEAVFGKARAEQILANLDKRGKALEELEVEYKDFVQTDAPTQTADKQAVANADKAFSDLLAEVLDSSAEPVTAAMEAVKAVKVIRAETAATVKALEDKYADAMKQIDALRAEMDLRPRESARAASKSAQTKIDDDHPLLKQSQLGMDEGLKEALPGLFKS